MTKVFIDDNFQGYKFECDTTSANVGFKHVCKVFDSNNNEISKAKSVINWGNRTWESYQYASVFEQSKQLLSDILTGKPEINTDFLYKLANYGYISDYGLLGNSDEYVILMDSWDQVEGYDEREYIEGQGMIKTGKYIKSVYAKLIDLAKQNRLKSDINYTLLNTDYVFTDEYCRCHNCGRIFNIYYGELTEVNYELLCDDCINSDSSVIDDMIVEAKDDYRHALKPTVNQDIISELGYSLVTDETFSFEREFWGAVYMTTDYASEFIEKYNGFIQIYEVAQFVCPFQIWVADDCLEAAQAEIREKFNID